MNIMLFDIKTHYTLFHILLFEMLFSAAPCAGGLDCCNEINKCDVYEGDCGSHSDCLDGLLCGTDNCPTKGGGDWDSWDDCCYRPGRQL